MPSEYPDFAHWPLILAGPILRRVEPDAVTVWLVLQAPCQVTLTIYPAEARETVVAIGTRPTVLLGQRFHVVAVTACPRPEAPLQGETLYAYDLQFLLENGPTPLAFESALATPGQPPPALSYFAHGKPTFALPPRQLHHLRLVHASCRKPHGGGYDALPILDTLMEDVAAQPLQRPHQLFLTGDQIYGDDVAAPLLWAATHLGDALLGWHEELPVQPKSPTRQRFRIFPKKLRPGKRAAIATRKGGFTAGFGNNPEKVSSHLLGLGEFLATYLLVWSPVCWPAVFPADEALLQNDRAAYRWYQQLHALRQFAHTLWKVRRALANIPTYMLFDDHDVSDDWNLNQAWCLRVLGQPLGQRTVQNALTACAVCQGWGNTPGQFVADQPGAKLLRALQTWSQGEGQDAAAYAAVTRHLGLPDTDPATQLPRFVQAGSLWLLHRHPEALTWHYTVQSQCHEIIALDTRTWRGFPVDESVLAPPVILAPQALEAQVSGLLQGLKQAQPEAAGAAPPRLTLVISPTNLFSLKAIDWVQHYHLQRGDVFSADVGDAWNLPSDALAAFLISLFEQRQHLVVLSGDIHYSFAVRLSFARRSRTEAGRETRDNPPPAVMVQLTASPLKNGEPITRLIHTRLKQWLLPERHRAWRGWNDPPHMQEQSPWQAWRTECDRTPDWICLLEWLPRQPAQVPTFGTDLAWLSPFPVTEAAGGLGGLKFWRSRWFQEGREVVGLNNLSLVQFEATDPAQPWQVIQDVYWFSPWSPTQIVSSRFASPLEPSPKVR